MTTMLAPRQSFDDIKHTRDDGSEFWSARELMPRLGYVMWSNFEARVSEARRAAEIIAAQDQFTLAHNTVNIGSGATRDIVDFHLSRHAVYILVTMLPADTAGAVWAKQCLAAMLAGVGAPEKPSDCSAIPGHLYVAGFKSGHVKVGRSACPRRRLDAHRRDSRRCYQDVMSFQHITSLTTDSALAERQALMALRNANNASNRGDEWFYGVPVERCVRAVEDAVNRSVVTQGAYPQ